MDRRASARALTQSLAAAFFILVAAVAEAAWVTHPVISQIYGGGGNSDATFTHDYIELFNPTRAPISLAGWSVQYASATGPGGFGFNDAQLTPLAGILEPGQYLLIQGAAGAGGTTPLPAPDITDPTAIAIGATSGKIALVNSMVPLGCNGGSIPCSAQQLAMIIDLVGWGDANFYEVAPGPEADNAVALRRANAGCTDTDDNAADFALGIPAPRRSASPRQSCAPAFEVVLNQQTAVPGDAVTVGLSAMSLPGVTADLYFVVVLPSGILACPGGLALLFVFDGGTGFRPACASDAPSAFPRYAADTTIPAFLPLLTVMWPAGAPPGLYTFAVVATAPGGLTDGIIDPGDVLAVAGATLTASP